MIGNNQLVSVLIPAYNHEDYVQETIKSIINQTYQNIELLIIDDGSKDNTWEKIQEMKTKCEKRFVNTHFETKNNEGVCSTLNKLINLSKGEFVYIIASDDIAKPQAIEKEINFLSNNPQYSLVVGDNEIIDKNGKICYWNKKRKCVYSIKQARFKTFVEYLKRHNNFFNDKNFGKYTTIFRGNYIPNGYLIRKSIYKLIGMYPEGQYLEDWWFMLQLSKYSKMKYLNEILFSYRWHDSNTIKNGKLMKIVGENTLKLENEILKNVDKSIVLKDVLDAIDNGVLYKKQGIPFIFQIISRKKGIYKIKQIKLFNICVYVIKKKMLR